MTDKTEANKKIPFADMSYEACRARYQKDREEIISRIKDGKVSASMSGIEYYPDDWDNLTDLMVLNVNLQWDGTKHLGRDFMEILKTKHPKFNPAPPERNTP